MAPALGIEGNGAGTGGKALGLRVKGGFGDQPFGHPLFLGRLGGGEQGVGMFRGRNACRTVNDEHRGDIGFIKQQLGFQQLKLKADRAQILTQQEIGILKGEAVGRAVSLGGGKVLRGKTGVFARVVKARAIGFCISHWR